MILTEHIMCEFPELAFLKLKTTARNMLNENTMEELILGKYTGDCVVRKKANSYQYIVQASDSKFLNKQKY